MLALLFERVAHAPLALQGILLGDIAWFYGAVADRDDRRSPSTL